MRPGELPDGVVVKSANRKEEIQGAKACEYHTFLGAGYIEPNNFGEVLDYRSYDPVSDFVVIVDDRRVVGMMRKILYNPDIGFKTLTDFELEDHWAEEMAHCLSSVSPFVEEIGTLGLNEEKRGKQARAYVSAIFRNAWQKSVRKGVRYWLFSADITLFGLLTKWFKFKVQQVGPGREGYMGSLTVPALLDIQKQRKAYEEGENLEEASYFLEGL